MIIVIGAGPAGLAMAYHLQRRGLEYRVLEKYGIGSSWQRHYDQLRLNTIKDLSGLPGMGMPRGYPPYPSASQFHNYLQAYATYNKLQIECNVEVLTANFETGGWHLATNIGEITAEILVVATGTCGYPYRPQFKGDQTFTGRILHSCEYRNTQAFIGKRVLVVGAGSSGVDIALDLAEHGVNVGLVVRNGINFVPRIKATPVIRITTLLLKRASVRSVLTPLLIKFRPNFSSIGLPQHPSSLRDLSYRPVVGYELADAVREGQVGIYSGIERITKSDVKFYGGPVTAFDTIILATGYRPSLDIINNEVDIDSEGYPILDGSRSLRNPNLFFVGFSKTVFRRIGWLHSIGGLASAAADQVAARQKALLR